jgi:hypothetical protein
MSTIRIVADLSSRKDASGIRELRPDATKLPERFTGGHPAGHPDQGCPAHPATWRICERCRFVGVATNLRQGGTTHFSSFCARELSWWPTAERKGTGCAGLADAAWEAKGLAFPIR